MPQNPYAWIDPALETVRRADWYRLPQAITSPPGAVVEVDGQQVLNFASNDYLGLAGDPRLVQAAVEATERWGTGSTGSRLLTGHRPLHQSLEQDIARLKQTEDALVFSSGYLANLGAIAAIVGQRDLILADKYNHASLKHGAVLSGATVLEYAHNDVEGLSRLLAAQRTQYRRCLIVTDSVFSMDGDLCPLPQLLDLAEAFSCMVLVDEAHATGVFGATGAGVVEHFGCTGRSLIQVGTLSKALGSLGGYVAGDALLVDFLRNRAATWIYTTGLSPADAAAAQAAIALVQAEPQRRDRLWQNVDLVRSLLVAQFVGSACFKLLPSDSPILCLQMPDAAAVREAGRQLKSFGILASAVRPPTVPTSRLRLSLMATHELNHCHRLVEALQKVQGACQEVER